MGIREFASSTMKLISISFSDELPVTARNNRHILCINDNFTKLIQIHLVPDRTEKAGVKCVFLSFIVSKCL